MEQKLYDAASKLPETGLDFHTIQPTPKFKSNNKTLRAIVSVAACFILLISIGFVTVEAKEYNDAIQFFNEYGLSTDGLSRGEIKAVYRDITTEAFTYSKTAEVIRNSLSSEQIGGYEIWQDEPTPEEIENLWNDKHYNDWFVPYVPDAYQFHVEDIEDASGRIIGRKFYIEKYAADAAVWRTYLPFWLGDYYEVADGIIVFGHETSYDSGEAETDGWIAKLDRNGTILWINQLKNGFDIEYPEGVLVNADGSYTLFSRGDQRYLCVSRYTSDGERTLYKETDLGTHGVGHIANYGDGYLLQISGSEEHEFARFIQVDQAGNVIDGFSYKDEKNNYVIKDMTEWGGKVYVSAYATPKSGEDGLVFRQDEIAPILDYVFNLDNWEISSEELTPVVRNNYAAVLLICDPNDGGKIQVFYTIPGSLGAELIIAEDGRLIWETESITSTFFSPATSSFTIGGICQIYQYAFDGGGTLIGRGKTGEITNYRR